MTIPASPKVGQQVWTQRALMEWNGQNWTEIPHNSDAVGRRLKLPFTKPVIGCHSDVYVDIDELSEHYCVFDLDWFDERDGEIVLRHQVWQLISDVELILPDPYADDEADDDEASERPPDPIAVSGGV